MSVQVLHFFRNLGQFVFLAPFHNLLDASVKLLSDVDEKDMYNSSINYAT